MDPLKLLVYFENTNSVVLMVIGTIFQMIDESRNIINAVIVLF